MVGEEKRRRIRRRRRRSKKEGEKKSKGMECLELLYGILGWNCLEHVWNTWLELFRTCMELMFGLGIFPTKFFVYM